MKTFEKQLIKEIKGELETSRSKNEKEIKFREEINNLLEKGEIDEVRDKLKQYRQFLLKYHDKQEVEEILDKYYQKLKE